jgi:hypothetical protein
VRRFPEMDLTNNDIFVNKEDLLIEPLSEPFTDVNGIMSLV